MKDFNFLPPNYRENLKKKRASIILKKAIVPYSVVMFLMISVPLGINIKLKNDKNNIQKEVSNEEYYKNKNDQYKLLQKLCEQREEQVLNLQNYGIRPMKAVEDLQKVLPDNMYLKNFNISKISEGLFTISMNCVAKTREDAGTFIETMRKDPRYYYASLSAFNESETTGVVTFSLSCTYKEKG